MAIITALPTARACVQRRVADQVEPRSDKLVLALELADLRRARRKLSTAVDAIADEVAMLSERQRRRKRMR